MKIGAENPKQVAAAGILLCVAAYTMYTQVIAPADEPVYPRQAAAPAVPAPLNTTSLKATEAMETARKSAEARGAESRPARRKGSAFGEWVPTLKPKKPEDRPDPATANPALRTDLFAKVQSVQPAGGGRNLFEFGIAPPKQPIEDVKIAMGKKGAGKKGGDGAPGGADGSKPTDPPKAENVKPPAPPVPLKYYGFVAGSGKKQAFFLNGEEIFAVSEGQTVQSRYKIVKIGDVSAVVEDLQHKNQQTIKLEEPPNT